VKRRLLLKAINFLNRHRWVPVRVQRWLWFVENRYVWDEVEIRLNDVPLKQGGEDVYPGAGPGEAEFDFAAGLGSTDPITFEVRSRDEGPN
jgi:hypothetical protein